MSEDTISVTLSDFSSKQFSESLHCSVEEWALESGQYSDEFIDSTAIFVDSIVSSKISFVTTMVSLTSSMSLLLSVRVFSMTDSSLSLMNSEEFPPLSI